MAESLETRKARMLAISAEIVTHAEAHWNDDGWDVIAECYTPGDLSEHFERCEVTTKAEAWSTVKLMRDHYLEQCADARNSAF